MKFTGAFAMIKLTSPHWSINNSSNKLMPNSISTSGSSSLLWLWLCCFAYPLFCGMRWNTLAQILPRHRPNRLWARAEWKFSSWNFFQVKNAHLMTPKFLVNARQCHSILSALTSFCKEFPQNVLIFPLFNIRFWFEISFNFIKELIKKRWKRLNS